MYSLNRKMKYEIIKELIENASSETIRDLVIRSGFFDHANSYGNNLKPEDDNVEKRRKELVDFTTELYDDWTKHYTDLTDRQYIKIMKNEQD